MFNAFKQGFAAIEILFMALAEFARALLHLSKWSEQTAAAFSDEATVEREKKMAALRASQKAQADALVAPATPAVPTTQP